MTQWWIILKINENLKDPRSAPQPKQTLQMSVHDF